MTETDQTVGGVPRWAWWAMIGVIVLVFTGLWMLSQGRLVAAIVCIIFGLVLGCIIHTILGYRERPR